MKRNRIFQIGLLGALLSLGSVPAAEAQENDTAEQDKTRWGFLSYPLAGNLNPKSGALLVRFRIEEDMNAANGTWAQPPAPNGGDARNRFLVAWLIANKEERLLMHYGLGDTARVTAAPKLAGAERPLADRKKVTAEWKQDEDHWVGLQWDEQGRRALLVDGQVMDEVQVPAGTPLFEKLEPDAVMRFGMPGTALTLFSVHTLSRPLTEAELAQGREKLFAQRESTLLLDHLTENFRPNNKNQTALDASAEGAQSGTPSGATEFVDTPQGRGLRLYKRLAN